MAKQLNVDLSFRANTSQAKAQIQELQKALSDVAKLPANSANLFDDVGLRKASQAALELEQHLNKAVNVDTGKLDLSRFSSSLKTSNKDLSTYCQTLLSTGEKGRQAFLQLAQAIAAADTPVTRINSKLAELGTTLKNTARWQLSSSILHGFMGAVQSAYGYAQDLNRSLNDIRIVTGASIDDMEKFAVSANKAAKALSATTTEYTNASLIYYQQGLSDEEVAKRTETTVKMANAAGQSAQVVSDQLTAIWNNFYDGSKSLEYYADVMTALGAATASSTDEIAGGLEKFAAIGETIGLSYEYAASALATITSNTRQSEEVVGTALKTIFARIQGLNLGETLDDGTTLNKYSKALQSVGISIFDQAGELKNMDNILNEMADKWDILSKAQQVALAQTVAGTRQYTQLIALMDNWDNGDNDSMTANLSTAYGSTGALQEQADIYAESWEAAQDRVTAAAENIYSKLLDDNFFIDLLNGFEKVLDTLGGFIDGLGGLQGVVTMITSLFLTSFAQKMPAALNNLKQNLMVFTGQANKVMAETQANLSKEIAIAQADPNASTSYKIQLEGVARVNEMKQKLVLSSKNLTEAEREEYEMKIKNVSAMYEEIAALGKKAEATEKELQLAEKALVNSGKSGVSNLIQGYTEAEAAVSFHENKISSLDQEEATIMAKPTEQKTQADADRLNAIEKERQAQNTALEEARVKAAELEAEISRVAEKYGLSSTAIGDLVAKNGKLTDGPAKKIAYAAQQMADNFQKAVKHRAGLENLSTSVKGQSKSWTSAAKAIKTYIASQHGSAKAMKTATKDVDAMKNKMQSYLDKVTELAKSNGIKLSATEVDKLKNSISNMNPQNVLAVTKQFEGFASSLDGKIAPKISAIDQQIDQMREGMGEMEFDPAAISSMEQAAQASSDVAIELDNAAENAQGFSEETPKGMFEMSTAMTQFGSAAMSASMMITSIQSAIDVFSNEGATGFEKLGAAISVVTAVMTTFNAVQALSTTLSKADKIAKLGAAAGQMAANAMAALGIGVKSAETGAVVANTAAWYANPIMWIALIIVGVVAALVALVSIIGAVSSALSDAYNADAIAAENAEKAAENLTKAYEDAKSAYEDMIGAMDNYQSARESLSELTKGTVEYQEALQEANAAALELLQNYPEYFGEGDYTWQDGELIISEEAMANAKQAELTKVQNAQAAATMATAGAKQARAVANNTEMKREQRDAMGIGDGDLAWKGVGAYLGSTLATALLPGIGGLLATGLIGASYGSDIAKAKGYDDAVDKSMELFAEDENLFSNQGYLAEKMAEVGVTNTELIQALWDNRDGLIEMGQEFNAAALQMKVAAENVANNLVQNNEKVQESGEAEAVAAVSAKAYENAYKAEQEKALADIKDRGLFNTGTDDAKALMAEYAKISGLDQDSNYEVTNYVGDGSVMVKKTLEDGSVEEVKLTAEEIAATVAAERANQQINASMETVMADMLALSKDANGDGMADDKSDQALKEFLTSGNLEGASKGQLEELQKEVIVKGDGTAFGDLEALQATAANLDATLSGNPEDYGYSSWLEMAKELGEAAEKTEEAWNNIELPEGLKNTADLSLEAAKKIQDDMESLSIGSQGAEGVKTYTEGINKLTESMTEAQKNQFMNEIGNIDWSSWYAMDDVTAMLEGMGAELNMTTEELEAFTNAMRIAGGASPTEMLAKTKSNIEALGATLSEGIAPGSVLDEETYQKLIEANKELEGQFMKTIDGSMKYVGSEEIGLDALDMGEYLETTREMSNLYENAKDDAAGMDFKGLSTIDYNFADEIAAQEKMVSDAQAAYDKAAKDHSDGFLGIKITTNAEQADLDAKSAATKSAQDNLDSMNQANEQAQQALADSLGSVLGSDDLMAVAEYCNYTEEQLTQMQENVKAGNEDAIKEAQEFNRQMNIFMAAGANGDYNISEAEEQIASTATSIEELDALTEKYQLSAETYSKAISGLFADAAAGAETLEELDAVKKKVEDAGGTVADSVYLDNVVRLTEEAMNAAKSIEDLNKAKDEAQARGAEVDMELYADNVRRVAEESMGAADSLSQLQAAWSEASETGVELDYSLYADNLLRLAESYTICADEARAFQTAMQSGNEEAIKAAEENLEATLLLGEAAEEYGFEAEELSIQSKQLAKEYGLNAKEAAKLAVENQRMNKGVESLVENWEEWGEELRKGDKTSRDWAKAAAATTKAIADLVGASEDLELPDDFFDSAHNMELLEQAAKGSAEAINELGVVVAAAQVEMMNFQAGMTNAEGNLIEQSQFDTWKNTVMSGITELQNSLDGLKMGDNIYEKLGGDNWVAALNEMAIATGMSVDQMNSLLNSMGVQAEVEVKSVKQKMTVPTYTEVVEPTNDNLDVNGDGVGDGVSGYRRYTIPGEPQEVEGYVQVAQVKASESDLGSPEIKFTGNGNVSNSAKKPSGGGGSSKNTSEARGKKSDMVDRYKEIDDKIDDTQKKMDDASKAADRLWGPARLAQMQKVNKALKEEIGHLKEKKKEADKYLQEDKNALISAASDAGVSFSFDETGNIANYEEQMTNLHNAREALLDSFGEKISESEQEKLDAFDKKADALKDAIAQYDETRELSEDLATEIQDKFYEWQDNNYEELNIELEYKLEVNDSKMEVIDYYMGKIEDDVYATAEAFGYLTQQTNLYTDNLANQEQYVKDLTAKYEAGEISLQAYKEGLASSQSAIISNLQSLEESKQAMQDYYGNVMDMALEKISMYTDEMDHLNSVLDHYSSIMELVGKQDDYATKNKILKSKANNIQGELQVQKELYDKSATEAKKWAEKMSTAVEGSNEYETYKKNWQAAQAAANEAQDAMLSKTEEWAEAMKSIIENELAEMADTLEKSLTGGVSFDELLTSMERRSSLQEEYLTTTNQIYETNKMMRTAQQEIDKTSNTVAKKKLQNFINETNQLQNQTKLSQYELDIQQAKYDLLLAEIALQEAQDAKSTVRLQRDAEGNFGYVYTADANQVADAEQKLADAQNNLYNIGLEGANDYQQKYAQTLQESQDAITELTQMWMNGEIANEEEFNRRKQEITEYYGEKLKQYSELHTIALSTDSRVLTDAWSSDFIERTASVEEWKGSVDEYFEGAAGSMQDWAEITKQVLADSGLSDMDKALQEVDNKSNTLRKTLIGEDGKGGVVAAMMSEVETAGKVSDAHLTIQNAIDKTIEKYEKLLTAVNNAHTAMNTEDNSGKNENNSNNNNNNNNDNNNKDNDNKDDNKEEEKTLTWDRVYAAYKKINSGAWGNGMSRRISNGAAEGYTEEEVRKAQELINKVYGGSTLAAAKSALGFDTGGYTGDWSGSYGKLAMLHKKELVLKEGDTENFLASMELLERILSIIDLQSANAQLGGMLSSPSYGSHATETIVEQNVHIEASFPGISDRNELQEAFTNLINQASQYANRK